MQKLYTNDIALSTSGPVAATTAPVRATAMMAEPKVGNAAVSAVVETATGNTIRQFAASATVPVTYPFHHKSENNQITPGDYAFKGTTGDHMIVTFFEQ